MDNKKSKNVYAYVTVGILAVSFLGIGVYMKLQNSSDNKITAECAFPDAVDELFIGQSYGVCTHDESFTEPVIPEGKYYPNGDRNADYYMEIKNGTFCLRWQDGSVASDDRVWGGEREYKVVTFHYADSVILCSEWHEYTDEEREQNGTLDKYSVIHGVSVTFRDGKAYIMPPAFRAGEGNVIRTDPSMQLSIPDENI